MSQSNSEEMIKNYKKHGELEALRQFAGNALMGILSVKLDYEQDAMLRDDWDGFCKLTAESSFDYADAMLAEYKKRYWNE
jgi:hypothetical protein